MGMSGRKVFREKEAPDLVRAIRALAYQSSLQSNDLEGFIIIKGGSPEFLAGIVSGYPGVVQNDLFPGNVRED